MHSDMIFNLTASIIEIVTGSSFSDDYSVLKVLVSALVIGITVLTAAVVTLFWLLYRGQKTCNAKHAKTWQLLSEFRSVAIALKNCPKSNCPYVDLEIPEIEPEYEYEPR